KDGKTAKDKEIAGLAGIKGRMITPELLIAVYFDALKNKITEAEQQLEAATSRMTEIEEEVTVEGGMIELEEDQKFSTKFVADKIKELKADPSSSSGTAIAILKE